MFRKLFKQRFSHQTAKNRLQMVLVQDRSGMSSSDMDNFKQDLLDVITKYFLIDQPNLAVEWERSDNETALVINTAIQGRLSEKQVASSR